MYNTHSMKHNLSRFHPVSCSPSLYDCIHKVLQGSKEILQDPNGSYFVLKAPVSQRHQMHTVQEHIGDEGIHTLLGFIRLDIRSPRKIFDKRMISSRFLTSFKERSAAQAIILGIIRRYRLHSYTSALICRAYCNDEEYESISEYFQDLLGSEKTWHILIRKVRSRDGDLRQYILYTLHTFQGRSIYPRFIFRLFCCYLLETKLSAHETYEYLFTI